MTAPADDAPGHAYRRRASSGLTKALDTVRARVITVILLATLPLAIVSSLLAWRDYQNQVGQSTLRVETQMAGYLASERAALDASVTSLTALAASIHPGAPAECSDLLDLAAAIDPGRYASLIVLDGSGIILCRARGLAEPSTGFAPLPLLGSRIALGTVRQSGRLLLLPASGHVPAIPGATIVAGLKLTPPAMDGDPRLVGAWLIGDETSALILSPSREILPSGADRRRLLDPGRPVVTATRPDGMRDVFVGGVLPGGTRIIMGDSATDQEAAAASILVTRIACIAALLAAGVAVVAIGAHVTVAAPVQILTHRVERWRTEGQFDDAPMKFIPSELTGLVDAFGTATKALAQRGAELEQARNDQELAFKEIHHRVKNNLQIIASLLNLQASRIRLPEAKAEFQSARDRVRALATLHRHLYADAGLHTIALRSFLLELCGQLFQAMGEREGQRISLDVDAPELQMTSDQAVPLALIVTEAVSNAVKYAFPDGRTGSVSVRLRRLDQNRIDLTIQDDGVGIPAGRAETESGVRDGLGIQLIRGFARQLGATLTVTEGEGTRYHLELTLRRAAREKVPAGTVA